MKSHTDNLLDRIEELERRLAIQRLETSTLRRDLARQKRQRRALESAIFKAFLNITAPSPQSADTRLGALANRLTTGRYNELAKLYRKQIDARG